MFADLLGRQFSNTEYFFPQKNLVSRLCEASSVITFRVAPSSQKTIKIEPLWKCTLGFSSPCPIFLA